MRIDWNDKELMNETRNAVRVATKRGAERVAKDAKREVAKDSGDLANSIKVEKSRFKDGGYLVTAQGPSNYDRFYATFVELGAYNSLWGLYTRKKGNIKSSPVKIKGRPFLRKALRKNKRAIMNEFRDALK